MRLLVVLIVIAGCGGKPTVHPRPSVTHGAPARLVPQFGHSKFEGVHEVALSPDGRLALTSAVSVRLWDTETGTLLRVFNRHSSSVTAIAFTPDSRRAITASDDGAVYVWDVATGEVVRTFSTGEGAIHSAISRDGRRILTGKFRSVEPLKLWDVASGTVVKALTGHTEPVDLVALSPAAELAASASSDGTLRLWDVATGAQVQRIEVPKDLAGIGLSPDARLVIAGAEREARVWEVATGRLVATLAGQTQTVVGVGFASPTYAVTVAEVTRVWQLESGRPIATMDNDYTFAVSADGARLLTGGGKRPPRVWDTMTGQAITTFSAPSLEWSRSVSFSADGALLAVTGQGETRVWDLTTLSTRRRIDLDPKAFANLRFAGAHQLVTYQTGGGKPKLLTVVDVDTGIDVQPPAKIDVGKSMLGDDGRLYQHAPDGLRIIDASKGTLELLAGLDIEPTSVVPDPATPPALSPDRARLASSTSIPFLELFEGRQVVIWNVATGQQVAAFGPRSEKITRLRWSRDGRRLLVQTETAVEVWDVGAATLVRKIDLDRPMDAHFLANGTRLVVANTHGVVVVWDLATGAKVLDLSDANIPAQELAVTRDERFVACARGDGTIRLSRLDNGTSIYLVGGGDRWVVYADDGLFDASRNGGSVMAAVDGVRPYRIEQLALRNNRPDELLTRMGLSKPSTISYFKARHDRRLAKLGLTDARLAASFAEAPLATIQKTAIEAKHATVTFELAARGGDLLRYNVFVNGVPLHGGIGVPITGRNFRGSERIELSGGPNRIDVVAYDAGGAESLHANASATPAAATPGDLYYIGFGVSSYRDPQYRLAFPHKDVQDVGEVFAAMEGGAYRKVHAVTYVDERATVANLKAAKALLAQARVDDTVVVFVAGHGVHSEDAAADYYFATYETDLARLASTAAKFELIESMLQDIAPRKKLLLMDTCESGERDDGAEQRTIASAGSRGLTARGLVRVKAAPTRASTPTREYLLDRERFIELDPLLRSGAVVLSSSRGSELSYELVALGNGVFTEHLLVALTSRDPDLDGDGSVSTAELLQFMQRRVADATEGLQHPTIDRDNLDAGVRFPVVPAASWVVTRETVD